MKIDLSVGGTVFLGTVLYLFSLVSLPFFLLGVPPEDLLGLTILGVAFILLITLCASIQESNLRIKNTTTLLFLVFSIGWPLLHIIVFERIFPLDMWTFYGALILIFVSRISYLCFVRKEMMVKISRQLKMKKLAGVIDMNSLYVAGINSSSRFLLFRWVNNFLQGKLPFFIGVGVCLGNIIVHKSSDYLAIIFVMLWLIILGPLSYSFSNKLFLFFLTYHPEALIKQGK